MIFSFFFVTLDLDDDGERHKLMCEILHAPPALADGEDGWRTQCYVRNVVDAGSRQEWVRGRGRADQLALNHEGEAHHVGSEEHSPGGRYERGRTDELRGVLGNDDRQHGEHLEE